MNRRKAIKISFKSLAYVGILSGLELSFSSCSSDTAGQSGLNLFNKEQFNILSVISDIIIPESETPGALQVGAVESIDLYLYHFLTVDNQNEILSGIDRINLLSYQMFQQNLVDIDRVDQIKVVQFLAEDGLKAENRSTHLFYLLREMIVRAYFESEIVSKEILKYDPIPTEYLGCIPFESGGIQWSL